MFFFFLPMPLEKSRKKKESKRKLTLHVFKEAVFLILMHYDCLYIDTICRIYLIWNIMILHITYGAYIQAQS